MVRSVFIDPAGCDFCCWYQKIVDARQTNVHSNLSKGMCFPYQMTVTPLLDKDSLS